MSRFRALALAALLSACAALLSACGEVPSPADATAPDAPTADAPTADAPTADAAPDCLDTAPCTVTVSATTTVNAKFLPRRQ
jgi:hypothetical protein